MPNIYPQDGFNLAAIPQYNPLPAAEFVRTPVQSTLQGVNAGTNMAGNLLSFAPELNARISQARLQNAQAQAQLPILQAQADAQAAQAKATKAQADFQSQALQSQAQKLQIVHGMTAAAAAAALSGGLNNPNGAAYANPTAIAAQSDTANAQPTAQNIPAQPQTQPQFFQPLGSLGQVAGLPAIPIGQPPTATQAQQPQAPAGGTQQGAQAPSSVPSAAQTIGSLWNLLPDEQRLELLQNVAAYQSNPLAQANVAKVYADINESVAHGNYFNAFAQWRAAEGANLLQTGGRYGIQNQILQGFQKAGIQLPNVVDEDAYNDARQAAQDSGLDPSEVSPLDYIDPGKLQAEIKRVATEKEDLKATAPGSAVDAAVANALDGNTGQSSGGTTAPASGATNATTGQQFYDSIIQASP